MSETFEHTEEGGADVTPLDSILGSDREPVHPVPGDLSSQGPEAADDDSDTMVPLGALKRVRERQKRDSARVAELEAEIAKYRDEQFGIFEEEPAQQDVTQHHDPEMDRAVAAYNQSYNAFVKEAGAERVAEIDAALNRLNAEQRAHVTALVGTGDVRRVVEYIEQQGVLFKPTSIQDALAGKQQPEESPTDNRDQELNALKQQVAIVERKNRDAMSEFNFIRNYGDAAGASLEATVNNLVSSGHPIAQHMAQVYHTSSDPSVAVASLLIEQGLWGLPAAQSQPSAPVMPSNFVAARSVASRRGATYSGPTPLNDIFARR
jgi:hypothetical protein